MKLNKFINRLYAGLVILCGTLIFTGCQAGLTYDEAPESMYSEVGVSGTPFKLYARQLFPGQVWAVNYNQYCENYMYTKQIDWETSVTTESNTDAPGGTLYVINVKAGTRFICKTDNKGFLFDSAKMSGDYKLLDLVDNKYVPAAGTKAEYVELPVKQSEVIGELYLVDQYNCVVERVDNAPALGTPSNFATPARYLVKNICYRPAGVQQYTRLNEVRVTFEDKEE